MLAESGSSTRSRLGSDRTADVGERSGGINCALLSGGFETEDVEHAVQRGDAGFAQVEEATSVGDGGAVGRRPALGAEGPVDEHVMRSALDSYSANDSRMHVGIRHAYIIDIGGGSNCPRYKGVWYVVQRSTRPEIHDRVAIVLTNVAELEWASTRHRLGQHTRGVDRRDKVHHQSGSWHLGFRGM